MLSKINGALVPAFEADREAVNKIAPGSLVRCDIIQPRNAKFHRKFFALLNLAFEAWEPADQDYKGLPVQKNFERFRKDLVIAAGFYDVVANIKGEVRAEAKSISFAKMDDEEFSRLYNAVANVILQRVMTNYTRDDLDQVVETILLF